MSETEARGGPFTPAALAWLIGVGVFAFAAFFVLSAYAPQLRRGNDGRTHALSKSAVGFAGAVKLLEAQGAPVLISRRERGPGAVGLLVLTPTLDTDPDEVRAMIRRSQSPVLVVLPKWEVQPHPRRPGWVRRDEPLPPQALNAWVARLVGDARFDRIRRPQRKGPLVLSTGLKGMATTPAGRIDALQIVQLGSPRIAPLLSTPDGAVLARVPSSDDRDVFILSDPDFLNTQGLAELETARAARAIIDDVRPSTEPIAFDVSLHGFEQGRSLLKLALSPPFLAVTMCAFAAAALAGWQAAVRFGPHARARRPFALGKQALADNAAALIKQSGREHRMARRYGELTQARAAQALGAPPGDEAAVSAYLDGLNRAGPDSPRLSALLAEAGAARTREQLLAAARRLHQWRREVQREH